MGAGEGQVIGVGVKPSEKFEKLNIWLSKYRKKILKIRIITTIIGRKKLFYFRRYSGSSLWWDVGLN